MTPKTFTSVPLPAPEVIAGGQRAAIEFSGLDQSGPTYEGRVFLNNPQAGPDTPMTPEEGYAGTLHIYSYGMNKDAPAEGSEGTALLPMRRQLIATDAIKRAVESGSFASVTLVPVHPGLGASPFAAQGNPVTVENVRILADGGTDSPAAPS